jgi:hypothetical protein
MISAPRDIVSRVEDTIYRHEELKDRHAGTISALEDIVSRVQDMISAPEDIADKIAMMIARHCGMILRQRTASGISAGQVFEQ